MPADARQAAALILLYPPDAGPEGPALREKDHPEGRTFRSGHASYSIPLTVRHADLPDHAGQISLPGGRIDAGETAEAAALREAHEEIGVDPASVRILGSLTPLYVMVSRFVVTAFVGVVTTRPDFQPASREVAELLEVPLSQLHDPALLKWGTRTREGYIVDFPYFEIGDHQVWGATAMMLGELITLLQSDGCGERR